MTVEVKATLPGQVASQVRCAKSQTFVSVLTTRGSSPEKVFFLLFFASSCKSHESPIFGVRRVLWSLHSLNFFFFRVMGSDLAENHSFLFVSKSWETVKANCWASWVVKAQRDSTIHCSRKSPHAEPLQDKMPLKRHTEDDKGREIVVVDGVNKGREAWVMEDPTNPTMFKSTKERVNVILKRTADAPEKASFTNFGSISFLPVGARNSLLRAMVKKQPKIGKLANAIVLEMSKLSFSPTSNPDQAGAALDELFTDMLEHWNMVDIAKNQESRLCLDFAAAEPPRPSPPRQATSKPHPNISPMAKAPPGPPAVPQVVGATQSSSFEPVVQSHPQTVHVIPDDPNQGQDNWSMSLNSADLSAQIQQLDGELRGHWQSGSQMS